MDRFLNFLSGLILVAGALVLIGVSAPPVGHHRPESAAQPEDDTQIPAPSADPSPETGGPGDAHFLALPIPEVFSVLEDPESRVNPLFQVPRALKRDVGFWLAVYAKYSLYQTLIYDKERPDVVYDLVDTRELFRQGRSAVVIEITTRNRVQRLLSEYRAAFDKLGRDPRARFRTGSAGARILSLWGRRSAGEWSKIAANLRTQPGQRDRVIEGLTAADPFIPPMEAIFRKFNLPPELTRLPLVESSFNTQAVSSANAVGVWQFLEKSATEHLIVDRKRDIDERLSPIKSAYAAAKMFQRNVRILGDYGLAVIAYNHGARRLMPFRHKIKGKEIARLLRPDNKASPLGYASRNYYSEFLAMLHAERYRDRFYIVPTRPRPEAISIVTMKKPISIFEVASLYNVSLHELRIYNPDIFSARRKLPAGTRIVVPGRVSDSLVRLDRAQKDSGRSVASDLDSVDILELNY